MFSRLGKASGRHPRLVVLLWLVAVLVSALAAGTGFGHDGLFSRLATTDFVVPGSDSEIVSKAKGENANPSISFLVRGAPAVDAAAFAQSHRSELHVAGVASLIDPFVPGLPSEQAQALRAATGESWVLLAHLEEGMGKTQRARTEESLRSAMTRYWATLAQEFPEASIVEVSRSAVSDVITGLVRQDLVRGETLSLPIAALLLIAVFGGALAACLPLIGAMSAIIVGLALLWGATFATTIDSFVINVISIIGVALSIDYGLLVVSRFREEARKTVNVHARAESDTGRRHDASTTSQGTSQDASPMLESGDLTAIIARTVATAGRTVSFSALTIALAIAGLATIDLPVLRIISFGGIIVTLLAVLATITLVPAFLALWGRKILVPSPMSRLPILRFLTKLDGEGGRSSEKESGFFATLARRVHAHPWIVMLSSFALLALMASPLAAFTLRNNFEDYIPDGTQLYSAYEEIQAEYPALATSPVTAVVDAMGAAEVTSKISAISGVTHVLPTQLDDGRILLSVGLDVEDAAGARATELMEKIRALDADLPEGSHFAVGGTTALQTDIKHAIISGMPRALGVVVVAVMVLLFLMTGSLLIPLKALLINTLSLLASLGATSFIFHHGLFGLPRVSGLETYIVACMVAFGFGLAMDYEVFLLARIKEYWDAGFSNDEAVERGLQRSGRIITSAAAIIIAVFIGFASGQMVAIKEIGVALAITVVTDATLTRLLLVPATMTLLGQWNWWAPRPLRWISRKLGGVFQE